MRFSRRRALVAFGALTAAPALGASGQPDQPKGPRFEHGVASGDPLSDRVVLWTRVSGCERPVSVRWQVATDLSFKTLVAHGHCQTDHNRDYTVKVDVTGLSPGTPYVYRFLTGHTASPIGHTRTLATETDKAVLAVVSCALHPNGYFNVYRAIADLSSVDAVVHLGDYIYEYGAGATDYGMGNGRVLLRIPEPAHEIVTLADYRTRHAQYKRDEDLQAAHARAPWICVFDDHEICNNPWKDGAENHNPEKGEGDWSHRKAAALTAYREWMPIRDPAPGALSESIYRRFRFGNLAELVMLESRLLARTKQLSYSTDLAVLPDGRPDYEGFRAKLNHPSRELLGATQRQWLGETLKQSVADGVRWQVLGNQILMARINGPNVNQALGAQTVKSALSLMPEGPRTHVETLIGLFDRPDPLPLNLDAWDGYPAERERVYDLIKAANARTIVLSGDSHCAWANELHDANGRRIAVELGVTAVSSPTKCLDCWLPDVQLAKMLAEQNAEVVAANDDHNGFVRLTLTPERVTGEWVMVDTITSKTFKTFVQQPFSVSGDDVGPDLVFERGDAVAQGQLLPL